MYILYTYYIIYVFLVHMYIAMYANITYILSVVILAQALHTTAD